MIRILIADDRPEVGMGLRMRLSAEPDMQVVGLACDGIEAVELAERLSPDVVLMDVEMPRQDGIEAAGQIHGRFPQMPVVILTIYDDCNTRARAHRACVASFISKERPVETLLLAIRGVAACADAHGQGDLI